MRIIYTPSDGEKREWTWRPAEVDSRESEAIEEVVGLDWYDVQSKFLAHSTRVRRAVLWVLLRREQPRLRFDQVRFNLDEFVAEWEDVELDRLKAFADDDGDVDDPLDQAAREQVRADLAEAHAVEALDAGVDPGKGTGADDAPVNGT